MEIYAYQRENNALYGQFLKIVGRDDISIRKIEDIPFFPVSLFKNRTIKTNNWATEAVFKSSGTTGQQSSHHVRDVQFYQRNARLIYENSFGDLQKEQVIGLLPNYSSNPQSSLISMVDYFSCLGKSGRTTYFHDQEDKLFEVLSSAKNQITLFGVSFALLDFCTKYQKVDNSNIRVIETGGMKRYAKELTRADLHHTLSECLTSSSIYSEYGMTECLSQAYTNSNQKFVMSDRFRVIVTNSNDPFQVMEFGQKGRVNIIDLANVDTLSFIATDDLGVAYDDDTFEILGRIDSSDLRGCNYLI